MNKTMYKVIFYKVSLGEITKHSIVKETDKCVWPQYYSFWGGEPIEPCRQMKRTTDVSWFDTFSEAQSFLVKKIKKDISKCEIRLRKAEAILENTKALKEVDCDE